MIHHIIGRQHSRGGREKIVMKGNGGRRERKDVCPNQAAASKDLLCLLSNFWDPGFSVGGYGSLSIFLDLLFLALHFSHGQ